MTRYHKSDLLNALKILEKDTSVVHIRSYAEAGN